MANAGYLPGPERKRRILESAKKVFAKRGYHDTSISDICEEIGIARGTLYQYFDSKHAVFVAIVESLLERVRAFVRDEPKISLPEGFRPTRDDVILYAAKSIERALRAVFEDEASLRILMREAVGLDVRIDTILRRLDDLVIDRFAADIEILQKLDIFHADMDPREAALFALGGVQKLALSALAKKEAVDLEQIAFAAAKLEMNGLLSRDIT